MEQDKKEKIEQIRKFLDEKKEIDRKNFETLRRKRWDNLKPFRVPQDVPEIPKVDAKEYREYYVPKLIAAGAIPKMELEDGAFYLGDHRRAKIGKWVEDMGVFVYWRTKMSHYFIDKCNHFEDDDGFALFTPIKKVTEAEFHETGKNEGNK
jgi:hypothetical protein